MRPVFKREITIGNILTMIFYVVSALVFILRVEVDLRELRTLARLHSQAINQLGVSLSTHVRDTAPSNGTPLIIPRVPEEPTPR